MTMRSASLALFVFIIPASHAFLAYKSRLCDHSIIPDQKISSRFNQLSSTVIANTKIHHDDVTNVNVNNGIVARAPSSSHQLKRINSSSTLQNFFLATTTAASILFLAGAPTPASAVSGGGLDYAGLDITGRDFSNGDYKGKDFTQTIAKGANFAKSNLQGCRFYKAYLVNTNFEGADARGASFEDTSMDNANLRNIDARGSYFGQSLLDVQSMEGGDFTDAQIPMKTLKLVCDRDDVKGTNPTTGAETRESLMCL